MPLQNRVTPFGTLEAVAARGAWTGNRGILHDERRRLTGRRWTTRAWITCVLDWRGRRREPMSPRTWTELFFLDEATALAAGHRPCVLCRRADWLRFRAAVASGLAGAPAWAEPPTALALDRRLHAERWLVTGRLGPPMDPRALPDGALVVAAGLPHLVWQGALHAWSHAGYGPPRPPAGALPVLTPATSLAALAGGYAVQCALPTSESVAH